MVRISDVINSESANIERQLAGGVTTCNLLHGSANPIGGQNAVVKLKFGSSPKNMIMKKAPSGIKFPLEKMSNRQIGEINMSPAFLKLEWV